MAGSKMDGAGFSRSLVAIAIVAVALGACSGNKRGGPVPYDVANFGAPEPLPLSSAATQYRVAPGDTLAVSVYKVPELTRDVEVDAAGGFMYPPLGRIDANNRTVAELGQEMQAKLGEKYLQSPVVQVGLKSTIANQITVDGSVTAPGMYSIAPGTTLLQALAIAKGPAREANLRRVVVFRQVGGQRMAAAFDLMDIRRGTAADPEVFARDIIVVDGSETRQRMTDIMSTMPLLSIFRPF